MSRTCLPELPAVSLEVLQEHAPEPGFLRVRRRKLRVRPAEGPASEPFDYDEVERTALDAVVIAAHFRAPDGLLHVFLRSALRPPVVLRPAAGLADMLRGSSAQLWELPAGLVEPDEQSPDGLRACAARELQEELGFRLPEAQLFGLGPSSFPAPSVLGERHFYFHCRVEPGARTTPAGDGSPLERYAAIAAIPLQEAMILVRGGEIQDAKTEIALRRLQEFDP